MKFCVFTLGSRGDVQPYAALCIRLMAAGHETVICTGGSFRPLMEHYGIPFVETASDLMALAGTPEGKAVLEHPIRNFRTTLTLSRDVVDPAYRRTLDQFFAAAEDADCIIYHPKALGAVDIANYYGIPCVSMPPVPITYPITEFPNPALPVKNLGSRLNRMSYLLNAMAESSQISLINDFRQKSLGQKKRRAGIYAFDNGKGEIPIIYPLSRSLFPEVTSWQGHVYLPGFFFIKEEGSLPEQVRGFLAAGRKPIAVTFSSMPLSDPDRFYDVLHSALEETGDRAVLFVGSSGIRRQSSSRILIVPAVSHQLLFPHVKGVIHHGGIGTLAAALQAGIPQLIMPFSVDQPFWAARMEKLGIGLKPLKEKDVTKDRLAMAFMEMEQEKQIQTAEHYAYILAEEDGTGNAVQYLEQIVRKGQ